MIKNFSQLKKTVQKLKPLSVSVAAGDDLQVINSLKQGRELGFIGKCFVSGDEKKIHKIIDQSGDKPEFYHIMPACDAKEAGQLAVNAIIQERCPILVKGSLKTEFYLRAILDKEKGIRTGSILANLTLFQMPSYHKFLAIADNAINILPSLDEKKSIIQNTSILWKALGIDQAKIAVLAAVETVSSKMPATLDGAALKTMAQRGQLKGFDVDGPLGYDAAIDRECALSKGIESTVCGDPDMLLCPNLETANSLAKSYKFHGNASWGGLILGAQVPAVLNSRSDDSENRLNSMMLARIIAEYNNFS